MKTQFNVRLSEECIAEIARVAGMIDGGTQAGVIERWAMESARGVGGVRKLEACSEKKSGARGEVFADDVPDDLPAVVKKKLPILPVGVTTAAKLEKKATVMGKSVRTLGDDGKIYINGVAQVSNLRDERLARANAGPILRPGQRK